MKTATRKRSRRSGKLQSGMTAVEITASLGIIAIGLIQATPMVQRLIIENQLSSARSALVTGLKQARSSAISAQHNITICPSSDSVNCAEDSWATGWIVFSDANRNGNADAGETIRANYLDNNLSAEGYGRPIVFEPDGRTRLSADVTISICFRKSASQNLCSSVSVGAHGLAPSSSQDPG